MALNDDRTGVIYRERGARRLHFDQVLDPSVHHFHQVPDPPLIRGPFSDFFIQMENFFACHQVHAKAALNDGRRYYRKWCDDRGRGLGENQACEACFAIT
jgi:hypothetical protein